MNARAAERIPQMSDDEKRADAIAEVRRICVEGGIDPRRTFTLDEVCAAMVDIGAGMVRKVALARVVAEMDDDGSGKSFTRSEAGFANGRLIAAAPDMYEALDAIANQGLDAKQCMETARAALTKVTP